MPLYIGIDLSSEILKANFFLSWTYKGDLKPGRCQKNVPFLSEGEIQHFLKSKIESIDQNHAAQKIQDFNIRVENQQIKNQTDFKINPRTLGLKSTINTYPTALQSRREWRKTAWLQQKKVGRFHFIVDYNFATFEFLKMILIFSFHSSVKLAWLWRSWAFLSFAEIHRTIPWLWGKGKRELLATHWQLMYRRRWWWWWKW